MTIMNIFKFFFFFLSIKSWCWNVKQARQETSFGKLICIFHRKTTSMFHKENVLMHDVVQIACANYGCCIHFCSSKYAAVCSLMMIGFSVLIVKFELWASIIIRSFLGDSRIFFYLNIFLCLYIGYWLENQSSFNCQICLYFGVISYLWVPKFHIHSRFPSAFYIEVDDRHYVLTTLLYQNTLICFPFSFQSYQK